MLEDSYLFEVGAGMRRAEDVKRSGRGFWAQIILQRSWQSHQI
jgi:hypothetical protein